jgi:hypothetical protein
MLKLAGLAGWTNTVHESEGKSIRRSRRRHDRARQPCEGGGILPGWRRRPNVDARGETESPEVDVSTTRTA